MKKEKFYNTNEAPILKVEEPMVSYQALPLPIAVLSSMSFQDMNQTKFSGKTLVDIQKQTSLSAQALAGVVGVSKSKYYELAQLKDLGFKNIDALADFATLWQKGIDAFDGDKDLLNEWLEMRNENLGDIKPIELLSSRIGRRDLEKAFSRIEYSTYG